MSGLAPLAAGCALTVIGLGGLLLVPSLLRKLIAFNVMGGGVFLLLIALAPRTDDGVADPVAQAMVLTGIVVAIAATALGLGLARLYREATGRTDLAEDEPDGHD